jgi:hypothetical protein
MSSDFLFAEELEDGLSEMLDTCMGYVANIISEEEFTCIED